MSKPRSAQTEVRLLKRELNTLEKQIRSAYAEIDRLKERLRIGALMSNVCYNAAQRPDVPQEIRDCMDSLRKEWDRR